VTFNGVPAPILYSSSGQVNLQVPYEIAGQSNVAMKIQYCGAGFPQCPFGGKSDVFNFPVVASQPASFLSAVGYAACGSIPTTSLSPLASNADGTLNSCSNPAVAGSLVQVYLNGVGAGGGNPATGAIAASPAAPLPLLARAIFTLTGIGNGTSVYPPETIIKTVPVSTDPGQVNSVWVATIDTTDVTDPIFLTVRFTLTVNGVATRDPVVIWMKH